MFGRAGDLSDQEWTQPAIFALECALTALWESVGVRPSAVLGHSLGELAAAQAAGVFGLEEGMRFAAARGELTAKLPRGAMAAIFADVPQVEAAIDELNAASTGVGLSIAAYNGAHQVVSGPEEEVAAIEERFLAEGHSGQSLAHQQCLPQSVGGADVGRVGSCSRRDGDCAAVADAGEQCDGAGVGGGCERLDGAYWRKHTREPVAFAPSMETLVELGIDLIIEVGPHAVLGSMATLAWPGSGPPVALSSLLRPSSRVSQEEADRAFTAAVAGAYEAGLALSFDGLFAGETRRRVALPEYPFQRRRHWIEAPKAAADEHWPPVARRPARIRQRGDHL